MTKNFVMVVPRGATGGTELGHQFIDVINECSDHVGHILYYPFCSYQGIQPEFEKYNCNTILVDVLNQLQNVRIVIPETYTYLVRRFRRHNVSIWWMSVDNYYGSQKVRYALANRFFPWTFQRVFSVESGIEFNLYQSEYARTFLVESGADNVLSLSDFLNPDFHTKRPPVNMERVVVYNPAKGIEYTEQILAAAPDIKFVPIVNMTRSEVFGLLQSSMVYIDFGNHPGKDRIPREAVTLGCHLIVGRRGSATNSVDVPIPDDYKFDVGNSFSPKEVVDRIRFMLDNYNSNDEDFADYRRIIRSERSRFVEEVCGAASIL